MLSCSDKELFNWFLLRGNYSINVTKALNFTYKMSKQNFNILSIHEEKYGSNSQLCLYFDNVFFSVSHGNQRG